MLTKNKSPGAEGNFLVGGSLSYADLALWLELWELSEPDHLPNW